METSVQSHTAVIDGYVEAKRLLEARIAWLKHKEHRLAAAGEFADQYFTALLLKQEGEEAALPESRPRAPESQEEPDAAPEWIEALTSLAEQLGEGVPEAAELLLLAAEARNTPYWEQLSLVERAAAVVEGIRAGQDSDAWVTAQNLWPDRFATRKKFEKFRNEHPEFKSFMFRNTSNKLLIHAGRWATYWAKQDAAKFERLERLEEGNIPSIADAPEADLTAAAERMAALRAKKQQGK